jgi:hypothetical protein
VSGATEETAMAAPIYELRRYADADQLADAAAARIAELLGGALRARGGRWRRCRAGARRSAPTPSSPTPI